MAMFYYKAVDAGGNQREGNVEAGSQQVAASLLRKQNLYPLEIREDSSFRDRGIAPWLSKLVYRIPRKDVGLFVRQLGTLLGAGIPLYDAIQDVRDQTANSHLKKVIFLMATDIKEGKSLSQSMAEHKDIFPPVYENMVRVGEVTGDYEKQLKRLAEMEEKNSELFNKTIVAFIYPAIMLVLIIGVTLFLLTSVVPQIEAMYSSFEKQLPLITRLVIGVSNFVKKFWWFLFVLLVATVYGVYRYRQNPKGKERLEKFILRLPLFGNIVRKMLLTRFTRNLGILTESNVNILNSLEITAEIVNHGIFKQEILAAKKMVQEGFSLKESFANSVIINQMTLGMLSAGETTDRLAEMLLKIADIMDSELDTAVRGFTYTLEPMMIVLMAGVVGTIMVAILLPIFKMAEFIQ